MRPTMPTSQKSPHSQTFSRLSASQLKIFEELVFMMRPIASRLRVFLLTLLVGLTAIKSVDHADQWWLDYRTSLPQTESSSLLEIQPTYAFEIGPGGGGSGGRREHEDENERKVIKAQNLIGLISTTPDSNIHSSSTPISPALTFARRSSTKRT